jgi:hypothetical protein
MGNKKYNEALNYNKTYIDKIGEKGNVIKLELDEVTKYYGNARYMEGYNDARHDMLESMDRRIVTYDEVFKALQKLQEDRVRLIGEIEELKNKIKDYKSCIKEETNNEQ